MTLTLNDPLPSDDPHENTQLAASTAPNTPPASPGGQAETGQAPAKPHRDRAIDLLRFGCLVVVVILHSMMSSAVLGPGGTVEPVVALSNTARFAAASWFFQIMPLFFVIGGYAGITGWRRTRARGGTWADYLRARLRRLVVPLAVLIGLAGLGLSAAGELGVSPDLLAEASLRIGQPLWFLAVYVGLTALVPVAVHVHETAPRRSLATLAGGFIVVDGLVAVTGMTGLGYLNFLFVWPLVQQLGFFYADALDRPVRRFLAWTVLAAALLALVGLVSAGVYSPNMLVNLNPPTGALVLLGVVQLCGMRLVHARLGRMLNAADEIEGSPTGETALDPRALRAQIWGRVITWGNRYGMHVYLWHMSIVIVLIGSLGALTQAVSFVPGASEFVLPEIGSSWWWATRLPWLIVVMVLSGLVAMAAERIPLPSEQRLASVGRTIVEHVREMLGHGSAGARAGAGDIGPTVGRPRLRAAIAVGAATAGIAVALFVGIAPLAWTVAVFGLLITSLTVSAGLTAQG
ncbi:acyltransferase family protein [Brevibacterium permense]|uniref:acyltransferase family protein n=1 Tax=Brevibacterium permense TaxID=234834 RepID=UPI0021D0D654|nr:acyltransferase [Brevibacterium permense]